MYKVIVTAGDKDAIRPFETDQEAYVFANQALQLKAANPNLTVKVRVDYGDGHLYAPNQKEQVLRKGEPVLSFPTGKPLRKGVLMPKRVGLIFCTHCGFYTKLVNLEAARGCQECEMSTNDFDMKTANGLWEKVH